MQFNTYYSYNITKGEDDYYLKVENKSSKKIRFQCNLAYQDSTTIANTLGQIFIQNINPNESFQIQINQIDPIYLRPNVKITGVAAIVVSLAQMVIQPENQYDHSTPISFPVLIQVNEQASMS